jgi:AraC-like DNA-binding protein
MARRNVASFAFPSASQVLALHVPRTALAPQLHGGDRAFARPIPAQSEPLRLLDHVLLGMQTTARMSPELQRLSVLYVYDLLSLALGATPDAAEAASSRGLRAARLYSVKNDILANLHRTDLTVASVAKRHHISPRYVQMLFESEGTSFSRFVRDNRLGRAHRMLASPRHAERSIAAIAYEAGFSDLSNFNHAFRRTYGMTPSDVRRAGQRE